MLVSKATLKCLNKEAGEIFIRDLQNAKIKKSLVDECMCILKDLKKNGIKNN